MDRRSRTPTPSVSVIVPVFNVEKYVAQCLDSLLAQELKELEIIVVNDGATDGTKEIVDSYSRDCDSIRLTTQDNKGLSAARNTGMRSAKGEYLGFVDGDDWVHPSMYRDMLNRAVESGADIVIVNGKLYNEETGEFRPIQDYPIWNSLSKNADLLFSPRSEADLFLLDTSACKRLYRSAFLRTLQFEFSPGTIFEDVAAHYKLLLDANLVALIDKPYYYYRTHRAGRITAKTDRSLFQVFDVMNQVVQDLHERGADMGIWANYVWFQSWVLRWLRKQIEPQYSREFDSRSFEISKKFAPGVLAVLKRKFENDDPTAVDFVTRQMSNTFPELDMPAMNETRKPTKNDTRHLGNDLEGTFNEDPHTFMPDIWGWVCLKYGIRSVLDIGCGIGSNLAWFDEYGFEVLGIEGHPNAVAASRVPGKIIQHDFCEGAFTPEREFDLCLCTEFAEHVEAEFEENWLAAVDKCRYLLLSAAPPGQGGYHHVNERPDEYWIGRLESRGFRQDPATTKRLRATAMRKPAPWGRNNLIFFCNKLSSDPSTVIEPGVLDLKAPQNTENDHFGELKNLRMENESLKRQLAALCASRSWRVTAPLRWARSKIQITR